MPRIREYRFEGSYTWFGKYLSIKEWKELKRVFKEYLKLLETNENRRRVV